MSIVLFNHENSPGWTDINQRLGFSSNGAKMYSMAITEHYWPLFEKKFAKSNKKVCLITATTENKPVLFNGYNRIFVFFHECRYKQQPIIERAQQFAKKNSQAKVTFIVWEGDCAKEIRKVGLDAICLPMAIDVDNIRETAREWVEQSNENVFSLSGRSSRFSRRAHRDTSDFYDKRIVYFGNMRGPKRKPIALLKAVAKRMGWSVDIISGDRLNGGPQLKREQILGIISRYHYGCGVGMCAHEMSALGLKVFIFAYSELGHLAMNLSKARWLIERNLCSPDSAKTSVQTAIERFDDAVVIPPVDIKYAKNILKKALR